MGSSKVISIEKHLKSGRPKNNASPGKVSYQVEAEASLNEARIAELLQQKACFVLATNVSSLSTEEVLSAYKQQGKIEKGFAFLKGPEFFTTSFFVKSPKRIEALILVMTLALLVYSIAQRRLRRQLQRTNQTLPNQINQPTENPTMRWIFQQFEGVTFLLIS